MIFKFKNSLNERREFTDTSFYLKIKLEINNKNYHKI